MSEEMNGVPAEQKSPGLVDSGALRDRDTAGDGQGLKVHPLDFATAKTPVHLDEMITDSTFHCFVPLMLGPNGVHQNRSPR